MSRFNEFIDEIVLRVESSDRPDAELSAVLESTAYQESIAMLDGEDNDDDDIWLVDEYSRVEHVLSGYVSYLCALNEEKESFYEKLWDEVERCSLDGTKDTKRAAIVYLMGHPALPYFQVETMSMDRDEHASRFEALSDSVRKVFTLLNRDFPQRYQRAAALLDVIEEQEDSRDRIVLLSFALGKADE